MAASASVDSSPGSGLSLYNKDGNEIPVLFTATPNASMNDEVLMEAFKMMEGLGLTKCGTTENGKPVLSLCFD